MKTVRFQTTWGAVRVIVRADGTVCGLVLPRLRNRPRAEFAFENVPDGFLLLKKMRDLPLLFKEPPLPSGTNFQRAVWKELKKIPAGQTRTYGQIAAAAGHPGAARAAGSVCRANPLPVFIPCHRVVSRSGPGGFSAGLPWKELLLSEETG